MIQGLSRRDFLKLASLMSLGIAIPPSVQYLGIPGILQGKRQNVLIVVFDALSAYNISLYGYSRETTPNLTRLAKRATVYHNHFAGGSFTMPGTASLLTGTLPWTHRAINLNGKVKTSFSKKNIFSAFADYHRIAYSHNRLVDRLLKQFLEDINEYIPREKLYLFSDSLIRDLFSKDEDIATIAWTRIMKHEEDGYSYSLFLSHLYEKYREYKVADFLEFFPYGLPEAYGGRNFTLEQAIDWTGNRLKNITHPFLGYFHFLPPHWPYKPHRDFARQLSNDSWKSLIKPDDLFTDGKKQEFLHKHRALYDEFILNVDSEFGRLFNLLESSGILDNTWVVFTSDHGEMFERGIWAHITPTLYQPIIRVPLLIFEPGQQSGQSIYTATSAIDLMPTLLHVTGHDIPEWTEGSILPPYAPLISPYGKNGIYAVEAKYNDPATPLVRATAMLVEDNYKLIYYRGYEELDLNNERIQLFNIQTDPEELIDLSLSKKETASELLNEIKTRLKESDEPYL